MIKIYDDFFTEDTHREVKNRLDQKSWTFNGGSKSSPMWHCDYLAQDFYFNNYLYKLICKRLGQEFHKTVRIYANGQTAGQCGTPHRDDGDFTFLYYPSLEWPVTNQGHLIFLQETGQNIEGQTVVLHRPNRAVIFDANMWHYADAPCRHFNGLRISLAYKLMKYENAGN